LLALGTGKVENKSGIDQATPTDNSVTYVGEILLLPNDGVLTLTVPMGGTVAPPMGMPDDKNGVPSSLVAPQGTMVQLDRPRYLISTHENQVPVAGGIETLKSTVDDKGVATFNNVPDLRKTIAVDSNTFKIRVVISPVGDYIQTEPELFSSVDLIARKYALVTKPLRLTTNQVADFMMEHSNLIMFQATNQTPITPLAKEQSIVIQYNQPVKTARVGGEVKKPEEPCTENDKPIGQFSVSNDYPHIVDNAGKILLDNSTLRFDDEAFGLTPAVDMNYFFNGKDAVTSKDLTVSLDPSCRVMTIKPAQGWPEEGAEYFVYGVFTSAYNNAKADRTVVFKGSDNALLPNSFLVAQPNAVDTAGATKVAILRKAAEDDATDVYNVYNQIRFKLNQQVFADAADAGSKYSLLACLRDKAYSGVARKKRLADGTIDASSDFENFNTHEVFFNKGDGSTESKIVLDYGECPDDTYKLKEEDYDQFLRLKMEVLPSQSVANHGRYYKFTLAGANFVKYNIVPAYKWDGTNCESDSTNSYGYPEFEPANKNPGFLSAATAVVPDPTDKKKTVKAKNF